MIKVTLIRPDRLSYAERDAGKTMEDLWYGSRLLAEHVEWFCTQAFPYTPVEVELGAEQTIWISDMPNEAFSGQMHEAIDSALRVLANMVARVINAKNQSTIFRVWRYVYTENSQYYHYEGDDEELFCGGKFGEAYIRKTWLKPGDRTPCPQCLSAGKNINFYFFDGRKKDLVLNTPKLKLVTNESASSDSGVEDTPDRSTTSWFKRWFSH